MAVKAWKSSPLGHQGVPCLFESFTGARTLVVVCRLSCSTTCGILVLQPGIKRTLSALKGGFLTIGPPRKFHVFLTVMLFLVYQ